MGVKPVADAINQLVIQITSSSANRDHAILLLGEIFKDSVMSLPEQHQDSIQLLVEAEIARISGGDVRVASGFFGSWAKKYMKE